MLSRTPSDGAGRGAGVLGADGSDGDVAVHSTGHALRDSVRNARVWLNGRASAGAGARVRASAFVLGGRGRVTVALWTPHCGRPASGLRPCGESRERPRLVAENPDGGSRARTTSSQGQRPAPRWRGDGQRTPPVGRDGLGRVSGWALLPRRPARGREREKLLLPVPVCAPGCVRPAPRTSAGTGPSLAPLCRTPAWELRSQARRDTSGA